MQVTINENNNIFVNSRSRYQMSAVNSPAFNRKNEIIENKIDKVVQHIDEEKKKKHNKTAMFVGGSVLGLSILVTMFNPRVSGKLIQKLKNLQIKTKSKFNRSKNDFLRGKFYKFLSGVTEKTGRFISFLNNANSVKDTYFKRLCTEKKNFPNIKNDNRREFWQKTDKIVLAVLKKPHQTLTRWGDMLAKHTVKNKYKTADNMMNLFENKIKLYYDKLSASDKIKFDKILKEIRTDREHFSDGNLQTRFSEYDKLMENLNSDIRKQWVDYRKGFKDKDVKTFDHFNKNMSFWAQDIMSKKGEAVNQSGIKAVDKLFGSISEKKGNYTKLIELVKPYMSENELVKINKSLAKTEKKLRSANKSECMEYFDKKRDLVLGSAPTDVVTAMFGVTTGAVAIMSADDKDKKISRMLTTVFPAIAGIGTNIALTSMLFSGPKNMVIASSVGFLMSLIGNKVNNYRLKLLGKSETETETHLS